MLASRELRSGIRVRDRGGTERAWPRWLRHGLRPGQPRGGDRLSAVRDLPDGLGRNRPLYVEAVGFCLVRDEQTTKNDYVALDRTTGSWPECRSIAGSPRHFRGCGGTVRYKGPKSALSARGASKPERSSLAWVAARSPYLTLYMYNMLGYSAIQTGAAYLPLCFAIAIAIAAGVSSQLLSSIGTRPAIVAGALIAAAGTARPRTTGRRQPRRAAPPIR